MKLLNKILQNYIYFIIGIILGLFISALISLNIWIDMRIHSYQIILVSTVFSIVIFNILKIKIFKKLDEFKIFLIFEIIFLIFGFTFNKFNRYLYDFKEFCPLDIDIYTSKIILIFIIFIANINIIKFLKNE